MQLRPFFDVWFGALACSFCFGDWAWKPDRFAVCPHCGCRKKNRLYMPILVGTRGTNIIFTPTNQA